VICTYRYHGGLYEECSCPPVVPFTKAAPCVAAKHGTWAAIRAHGCICPEARNHRRRTQAAAAKRRYLTRGAPKRVPAIGARRRKQALAVIGWAEVDLEREFGPVPRLRGKRHANIDDTVDRWWRHAFDTLGATDGPNQRAKATAKTKGWAPPLAWLNIDDPDEQPALTWQYRREVEQRRGQLRRKLRNQRRRRLRMAGFTVPADGRSVPTVTQKRRHHAQKTEANRARRDRGEAA
jgi:hypothetical protein